MKPKKVKADKFERMSYAEQKEYLRNAEVIDIQPNPRPGTGESFIVTLAKPERRAK